MPTKFALVVLAVTTVALGGCQTNGAEPAQPAATTATPSAGPSTPAGNGVAALGADEILKRAKAALTKAKSFRAKGATTEDGQKTEIDLKVNGADFGAVMAFGKATVELLEVDGKKYFRPDEQFWTMSTDAKQGKALAKAMAGRWIVGAESDQSFASMFTIGSVDELLKPTGAVSKGEEKEIGGVPAIGLKDAGDPGSALYIATTGEPYPLRTVDKDGSAVVFSGFGEPITDITKPAADKVVDLAKVTGK